MKCESGIKLPFDLRNKYGDIFKVFDRSDSGNICVGTEKDGEKFFIKLAFSSLGNNIKSACDIVENLKSAVPLYIKLHHKNLIEFVNAENTDSGFAMVFKWAEGDSLHTDYGKLMNLDNTHKIGMFNDIIDFLEYVNLNGYAAVDFYDGSIIYDSQTRKTVICDIDLFRKQPFINDMGRMYGSTRFMSPEEFRLGATIDEITNVYTAGAFAFALFGNYSRAKDMWQLSDILYETAVKAICDDRNMRFQSIKEFKAVWNKELEL